MQTDIYFFTDLTSHGEVLPYPLPAGHVDIHHWVKPEGEGHYGPNPLEEGCIRIATVVDLVKRATLAMIVRLVGLASPNQCLRPHIVVLQ